MTSTSLDIDAMETGLMDISKNYASPSEFIYQPGQIITEEDAYALLEREYTDEQYEEILSEDDEAVNIGLNPPLESDANPEDSKIYATTIIEQNYGTLENDEFQLDTIAIGIGIPYVYTYGEDDALEEMEITRDEIVDYAAKEITNDVIYYVREYKNLASANIVIGFYLESEEGLLPGNYVMSAYVPGESSEPEYTEYSQEYVLYPSVDGNDYDPELNQEMVNINNKLTSYFSEYAGFYAEAEYNDGTLTKIEIIVTANIYSSVDAISFTNYVEEVVLEELSVGAPIDIYIRDTNFEPLSLIEIENNSTQYKYIY